MVQSAALTEQRSAVRARYFLPGITKPRKQPVFGVFSSLNVCQLYSLFFRICWETGKTPFRQSYQPVSNSMSIYIQFDNREYPVTLKPIDGSTGEQVKWVGTIDENGKQMLVVSFTEGNGFVDRIDKTQTGVQTSPAVLLERLNDFLRDYRQTEQYGFESTQEEESVLVPYDPEKIKIRRDNFSIFQLYGMIEEKELDLNPDFQRNVIWDNTRKSRLIESILLGIPLPMFYFAENRRDKKSDNTFNVVDGLQRLSTIRYFMNNEFRLKNLEYLKDECEGKYYKKDETKWITEDMALERRFARRIEQAQLSVNIIDASSPAKVKYDIFRRINEGGRPLNKQEIRNCIATTDTRAYLKEMAQSPAFIEATGSSINSTRMDDQELVLRFTAFHLSRDGNTFLIEEQKQPLIYTGDMNSFLDDTLEVLNTFGRSAFAGLSHRFLTAMHNAHYLFGRYCFRKCLPEHLEPGAPRQLINKSLFTTWSIELSKYNPDRIHEQVAAGLFAVVLANELAKRTEYYEIVTTRTTDRKSLDLAFEKTQQLLATHLPS